MGHGPDRVEETFVEAVEVGAEEAGELRRVDSRAQRLNEDDLRVSLRLREADEAHEPEREEGVGGAPRLVRDS